ncbi:MAG: LytTR family DNA-binding domain-containing protein [Acidobacteriota bacterium]
MSRGHSGDEIAQNAAGTDPTVWTAVVVDDERLARLNLQTLLARSPRWTLVAEATTGLEALEKVADLTPHAVFLDIRMPGLDGLELAAVLSRLARPPLVVFVTAYGEHALEAFAVEATDYLTKPFDDERFERTLLRLERRLAARRRSVDGVERALPEDARATPERGEAPTLAVKSLGRVRLVRVAEIEWIAAAGNYVRLYLGDACLLHRATLSSLAAELADEGFVRIHRSTLVRRDRVVELRTPVAGRALVVLSDGTELDISQRFRQRAFEQLLPS